MLLSEALTRTAAPLRRPENLGVKVTSTMQLPPGVPVATVGIDNGKNAALLAARILAISDAKLSARLMK